MEEAPKVTKEWQETLKRLVRNLEAAEGRVVKWALAIGQHASTRPEGTKLKDIAEAMGLKASTTSTISLAATVWNDYVVLGGADPKDLEKWSLRTLYEWRPSDTGLKAETILAEKRTVAPKVEELPADSPKVKREAKKAAKRQRRSGSTSPKVTASTPKESDAPKESEACRSDEVRVKLSRGTLSRLTELRSDRFPTIDDVVKMLLDRQTPSGNGQVATSAKGGKRNGRRTTTNRRGAA